MDKYERAAVLKNFKTPLKAEWMMGDLTALKATTSAKGNDQIVLDIVPLDGGRLNYDLKVKHYVPRLMDRDGPKAIKQKARKGLEFLTSVLPDFPRPPERVAQGQYEVKGDITVEGETYSHGTVVDWKTSARITEEIDRRVFETLDQLGENEEQLKALEETCTRVFFKPQIAELDGKEVKQFIDSIAGEIPANTTLVTDGVVDEVATGAFLAQLGVE